MGGNATSKDLAVGTERRIDTQTRVVCWNGKQYTKATLDGKIAQSKGNQHCLPLGVLSPVPLEETQAN